MDQQDGIRPGWHSEFEILQFLFPEPPNFWLTLHRWLSVRFRLVLVCSQLNFVAEYGSKILIVKLVEPAGLVLVG